MSVKLLTERKRKLDICSVKRETSGEMGEAICKANAREMGLLGAKVRWERAREAKLAAELAADAPEEPQANSKLLTDKFTADRLRRVRKQLEKVDRMIDTETDPQKLDRLASAAARLNEQERQLSNRSMPPVIRANQERKRTPKPGTFEPEA